MSKTIILQLADQIRSHPLDAVGLFLARMCAWAKLSNENRLPEDLRFPTTGIAPWPQLRAVFESIAISESLTNYNEAFRPDGTVRGILHIDEKQLASIGITLRQAIDSGTFDYVEAFNACFDVATRENNSTGLPPDVAELMFKLKRGAPFAKSVYCPFDASLGLALYASMEGQRVVLEVPSHSAWPALANILAAYEPIKISFSDPILNPSQSKLGELTKFDLSLAAPPLGEPRAPAHVPDIYKRFRHEAFYTQTLYIQHLLAQTDGRIIVIVPDSFLARATSGERFLKEEMLRRGQIAAVIALPPNLLYGTTAAISIMVIDTKGGNANVLFVDVRDIERGFVAPRVMRSRAETRRNHLQRIDEIASIVHGHNDGEFSRCVSTDECIQTRGNLAPNRYLAANAATLAASAENLGPIRSLAELAELIRPQMVRARHADAPSALWAEIGHDEIPEAGYILGPGRPVAVDPQMEYRAKDFALQPNDILVSFRGTIGRVGMVSPDYDHAMPGGTVVPIQRWLASQGFLIVRVKSDVIRPAALYLYLKSKLGEQMLKSRAAGATVPAIQAQDLNELPIPVPPRAMQEKWQRAFDDEVEWANAIQALRAKIAGLRDPGFFGA